MGTPRHAADTAWLDGEAGPVVRPYAMTSGRTRPVFGAFDLISIILSVPMEVPDGADLAPEAAEILRYCRRPMSVAEIAAHLDLPAGTVKVLLGDLLRQRLIRTRDPETDPNGGPSIRVLEAVINGLRAL
jgi:hypothetical protein